MQTGSVQSILSLQAGCNSCSKCCRRQKGEEWHSRHKQGRKHLKMYRIYINFFNRNITSLGVLLTKEFSSLTYLKPTLQFILMMWWTLQTTLWRLGAKFQLTVRWECPEAPPVCWPTSCCDIKCLPVKHQPRLTFFLF